MCHVPWRLRLPSRTWQWQWPALHRWPRSPSPAAVSSEQRSAPWASRTGRTHQRNKAIWCTISCSPNINTHTFIHTYIHTWTLKSLISSFWSSTFAPNSAICMALFSDDPYIYKYTILTVRMYVSPLYRCMYVCMTASSSAASRNSLRKVATISSCSVKRRERSSESSYKRYQSCMSNCNKYCLHCTYGTVRCTVFFIYKSILLNC